MNTRLNALVAAFTLVMGGGLGGGLTNLQVEDTTTRSPDEVVEETQSEDVWQHGWHGRGATNAMREVMSEHMPGPWPEACEEMHREYPHEPGEGPGPGPGSGPGQGPGPGGPRR